MRDVIKSQQASEEYKLINGRRVKLDRRRRRSNLNNYYAIAVVLVAVLVMILCMTFFFNVRTVNINGVTLYTQNQIYAVGGITDKMNLIRTDTDVIEKRLLDNLVYIDSVSVKKKYPYALDITVTEAVKAADIEYNGKYYLLSESGRLLETENAEHDKDLPLVKGFELKMESRKAGEKLGSEDQLKPEILMKLLECIKDLDLKEIKVIDLTDRTDIILNYDDRIDICIGSSVDMDVKLRQIKAVIDERLSDEYVGTLRYNGASSGISGIPRRVNDLDVSLPDEQDVSGDVFGETSSGESAESGDDLTDNSGGDSGVTYDGWNDNTL